MADFNKTRFYLFTHSYSGYKIANHIKMKYKGRKLLKAVYNLSRILGVEYNAMVDCILLNHNEDLPYKKVPRCLKIYLEIEKELMNLYEEKLDEYSTAVDDYQRQLLYPAIERAVGNFLTDVKNDNKFQRLLDRNIKHACYSYYKVVDKYCLPTMRVIPFILRLIS